MACLLKLKCQEELSKSRAREESAVKNEFRAESVPDS